jgi:hypothetical protein
LRDFVDDAVPIQEQALKASRELNPPDELASDWNRFLELAEKDLSATQDLNQALKEGDG